ncbi:MULTISPECIES: hypothetical protein [unclassified Neisseria]|uniref:hypothetical protein n=1 Tax=unclassified Neisseria TaxID=2623750 RepID=UPI002665125B|nr:MULTISPECIES: hypothetical protein [unclassified Neisseria]MDO1510528.1 hypothetical protein [Neisseria sp. MVDL19-042950]MDO1516321.1 hypothetical protein [Neisseria sp. MVDL18-041461]MDO1564133.1 hypothetical protein [Neisseria sp. MVDL20-010259]
MRMSVFLLAAVLVGGTYYLQESPELKQSIKQTFSRENLFEVKFKDAEKQKEYEKNKSSLFYSSSQS